MEISIEEGADLDGLSDFECDDVRVRPVAPKMLEVGDHLRTDVEWSSMGLSMPVIRALNDMGYANPTPIQRDTIPHAIRGCDILGMAETGSGKTGAFLIPAIERLLHSAVVARRRIKLNGEISSMGLRATKVLVLLPTRELAEQCFKMCGALCKYSPITRILLRGGTSLRDSEAQMRQQPDIVIATPGRCLDLLLNSSSVHLDLLDIVIFDEADRLVEMGFKTECLSVLSHCSKSRQTLLFSATLSTQADELAAIALKTPVLVPENVSKASLGTALHVQQSFFAVKGDETLKFASVIELIESETMNDWNKRIVIFFNTKRMVHFFYTLWKLIDLRLPPCAELHGNLSGAQRSAALASFQDLSCSVLLATDVAARGLDFNDVALVINAELPNEAVKYVHRVGRSGRKGQTGRAITFYNHDTERAAAKSMFKASCKGLAAREFKSASSKTKRTDEILNLLIEVTPRVQELVKLEAAERAVAMAERASVADENATKYKSEIKSRPAKRWIEKTPTEKKVKRGRKAQKPESVRK